MEFARERELVHLRYELRQLVVDGRREEAPALLERLRQLASADEGESPSVRREITRWESTFGL